MDNEITRRVGTFFILVGCAFLVVFIGSILGNDIKILYLFFSAAALLLGYLFHRKRERPEPTRFAALRKANQRARQRREEKEAKKAQKK